MTDSVHAANVRTMLTHALLERRSSSRITAVLVLGLLGAAACGKSGRSGSDELKVATAASLVPAMEELATLLPEVKITIVPGASGKLAKQIEEGAPFDVFASADDTWADRVIAAGDGERASRLEFAFGRVAVWTAEGVEAASSLADLLDPRFKKISLANPDHAPYGKAGRQALQKSELWAGVEGKVVYGSDVRQALQFAETGNTEAAIVALSLVQGKQRVLLIDDAGHAPLAQVAVVLHPKAPHPKAAAFMALLASEAGHAVLRKYGLLQRGESL